MLHWSGSSRGLTRSTPAIVGTLRMAQHLRRLSHIFPIAIQVQGLWQKKFVYRYCSCCVLAFSLSLSRASSASPGGQMMVTDLQGFQSSILTDPQIHCIKEDFFGRGNLGKAGMDQSFLGHSCNWICAKLKLKQHPMQLQLDDAMSIVSGTSTTSSELSSHGSQICELCGALFKLRGQEYLVAMNKYQAGSIRFGCTWAIFKSWRMLIKPSSFLDFFLPCVMQTAE